MPSISADRVARAAPFGAALIAIAALAAVPVRASQLCELGAAVASESQLRERLKRCRKEDVVIIAVASASLPASRAAAVACDFAAQILIEDTTESPGIARVSCRFSGDARRRR